MEINQPINVTNNTDKETEAQQAIQNVFDVMAVLQSPVTAHMDSERTPEETEILQEIDNDASFEPIKFDDNPQDLASQFASYSSRPPSKEVQETFISKLTTNLQQAATASKPTFFKSCKVAIQVIESMSSLPFPYGPVVAGIKGVVEQWGGDE